MGILGSCAAHEELESPAPAAGLAFLESVSEEEDGEERSRCVKETEGSRWSRGVGLRMEKEPKVPQCVRGEVALPAASGFQFDESPTRRIERAHQRDAHAQYDEPVAHDDACKELASVIPEPNSAKPNVVFAIHSPKARFLAVTSEHGW